MLSHPSKPWLSIKYWVRHLIMLLYHYALLPATSNTLGMCLKRNISG